MKGTLAVLVVVIVALAMYVNRQDATIKEAEKELAVAKSTIDQLNTTLAKRTALDSLELQSKCSKQASEAFKYMGYENNQAAGFTSHYNQKLGKCFIQTGNLATFGKTVWTYKTLYDAFEQKQYGDYAWHTDPVKKYWEVPPFMCKVTLPSGEEKLCKSDDEFEALVKTYMER